MTMDEIKQEIMFQSNNDVEDLEEFLPYLDGYINEGYDKLVYAWAKVHCGADAEYPFLAEDDDVPNLPEWCHRALCDYGTWMVYRNGNPQKQQRGQVYLAAFEEMLTKIRSEGGKNGPVRNFFNIPR